MATQSTRKYKFWKKYISGQIESLPSIKIIYSQIISWQSSPANDPNQIQYLEIDHWNIICIFVTF